MYSFFFNFQKSEEEQQDKRSFSPAKFAKVPYIPSIKLVITAAQEYFNSAQDSRDPLLELAKCCLCLIKDRSPQVIAELNLIYAISLLEQLNVHELPLKVRLTVDKLELLSKALQNNSKAYLDVNKLIKLATLLSLGENQEETKIKEAALLLCAEKAVSVCDYPTCAKYCDQLIQLNSHQSWKVCQQLGCSESFKDKELRLKLLKFAVAWCSEAELVMILHHIAQLKGEADIKYGS